MSQTLNLNQLTSLLQLRIPMNLATQFCYDRLNEGYRWLEQQGPYVWDQQLCVVTVAQNAYYFDLTGNSLSTPDAPSVVNLAIVDVGKPIEIWASASTSRIPIPFVPANQLGAHQIYNITPVQGSFSAYTIMFNPTNNCYQVRFAPTSAQVTNPSGVNFAMMFHQISVNVPLNSGSQYFPSPDQFDDMIVDLAEAETKRIYNLAGWDTAMQKAKNSALLLLDPYRSEKRIQTGIAEETREAQESAISKA